MQEQHAGPFCWAIIALAIAAPPADLRERRAVAHLPAADGHKAVAVPEQRGDCLWHCVFSMNADGT